MLSFKSTGTSNWEEDYYSTTAGVTFIFTPVNALENAKPLLDLRQQMKQIFLRDFTSDLARTMK